MKKRLLSLVVPVFNEEATIPIFYETVRRELVFSDYDVEIVFINDGSRDKTEEFISDLAKKDPLVKAFSFTRNFGKEPALFCGLEQASGDAVIPIDVDLQDPVNVIPKLVSKREEGFDVVLAKRADRSSDTWIKRKTAEWFYRLHNAISTNHIEPNVGDFRLLSRKNVNVITSLPERNLFMKGIQLGWRKNGRCRIHTGKARCRSEQI